MLAGDCCRTGARQRVGVQKSEGQKVERGQMVMGMMEKVVTGWWVVGYLWGGGKNITHNVHERRKEGYRRILSVLCLIHT